tara:strand:+ start:89 stop:196 length:108 start_codon:yes stop_codon:yes gene_type:complete
MKDINLIVSLRGVAALDGVEWISPVFWTLAIEFQY